MGLGSGVKVAAWQSGVSEAKQAKTELLALTLDKDSGGFSPTTRYRDFAISRTLVHLGEPVRHPRRQPNRVFAIGTMSGTAERSCSSSACTQTTGRSGSSEPPCTAATSARRPWPSRGSSRPAPRRSVRRLRRRGLVGARRDRSDGRHAVRELGSFRAGTPALVCDVEDGTCPLPPPGSSVPCMTPQRVLDDIIDSFERADMIDMALPAEAIDSTEATEPIDRSEPTDPIERTEPFDPIDSSESSDHRERREVLDVVTRTACLMRGPHAQRGGARCRARPNPIATTQQWSAKWTPPASLSTPPTPLIAHIVCGTRAAATDATGRRRLPAW